MYDDEGDIVYEDFIINIPEFKEMLSKQIGKDWTRIAIFENKNGVLIPKTQAKDMIHAENYINMIEPLPYGVQIL